MTRYGAAAQRRWAFIGASAAFVLATQYVGIAAGAPMEFLIIDTTLGLLFVVAGAIAWARRPESRTGPLLVACAALWSLGSYGPTQFVPVWAIGFAFEGYYDILLALLALTFPADRLGALGRTLVWSLGAAFLLRSAGRLLLSDPPRTYPAAFPDGPVNVFALFENRVAFEAVEIAASVVIAVLALVVGGAAVRRLVSATSLTRSVTGPVLVGSVVAMVLASYDAAETAWSTATGGPLVELPEPYLAVFNWLIPAGRAVVPLAFLIGTLRLRSASGPLATLAARLDRGASPEEVDEALSAYIENEQLAELLSAQLAELRASRVRIVAAGDAERRRIERALHDGAQQHLTGVAMRLDEAKRLVDGTSPALADRLEEMSGELRDAMHELRELARGIHPAILTEAGLRPAISTLARRSTVPVHVRIDVDGRLPLPTEVTAYYVVAEALTNVARSARASRVQVDVRRDADGVAIRVRDDGVGGADPRAGSGITGLEDRVRALNGRFRLDSPAGRGTDLEVWLPCA